MYPYMLEDLFFVDYTGFVTDKKLEKYFLLFPEEYSGAVLEKFFGLNGVDYAVVQRNSILSRHDFWKDFPEGIKQ